MKRSIVIAVLYSLSPTNGNELIPGCSQFKKSSQSLIECPTNPTHPHKCIQITGFSTRDFAASGIYCQLNQEAPYQRRVSDSLRYELIQRESERYELLRVIKSKRDRWVGIAIYAALLNAELSLEEADWYGYSIDAKAGESRFDPTEPRLNATFVEPPVSYITALNIANEYRLKQIDACDISLCDVILVQSTETDNSCHHWRATAQLAELVGNHLEAVHRYSKEKTCVQDEIHALAMKHVPISRHARWKVAEISHLMAKSLVKSGRLQSALDAVVEGLAHSPEQKQR
jgi:hypothetical protein